MKVSPSNLFRKTGRHGTSDNNDGGWHFCIVLKHFHRFYRNLLQSKILKESPRQRSNMEAEAEVPLVGDRTTWPRGKTLPVGRHMFVAPSSTGYFIFYVTSQGWPIGVCDPLALRCSAVIQSAGAVWTVVWHSHTRLL